jgi:hypothetical protein
MIPATADTVANESTEAGMVLGRFTSFCVVVAAVFWGAVAGAQTLPVANGSFESPVTTFATPGATGWNTDGPYHDPQYGFNPYTGIFLNTAVGQPDNISNALDNQLVYIGTQTGNEFTQLIPNTNFQAGEQYTLNVGVARSYTSPPAATDLLRIALYYMGTDNQRHLVGSTDILNNGSSGLSANLLKYFTASTPVFGSSDPAVGNQVGVLLTTVGAVGGYFDLDNVTVTAVPEPGSLTVFSLIALTGLARRRNRQYP